MSTKTCQCPTSDEPFHCSITGCEMTPHQQHLCQSRPKYRAFFQGQRCGTNEESTAFVDDVPKEAAKKAGNPPKIVPKRTANSSRKVPQHLGPGTHLKRLLAELGAAEKSSCGCNKYAQQMDAWGVEGCRSRRSEICSHLKEHATWRGKFTAAVKAVQTGIWISPLDPYGSLVDEAIRRAEKHLGVEGDVEVDRRYDAGGAGRVQARG